jgi:hypothetical protein
VIVRRLAVEMFLMLAVMSLLGVTLCAALFAAATRDGQPEVARPAKRPALSPQRFFASATTGAPPVEPATSPVVPDIVPVEALLLQIEKHIRLEQAAAESFLHTPTGQSLHSRTTSPLVN